MSRGYQRQTAPGTGVAKGEYILQIMPAQSSSSTTSSGTYAGLNRLWVVRWEPANWPTNMSWYLEALMNGYGEIGLFQYDNTSLITGTAIGALTGASGYAYPPAPVRGSTPISMPVSAMWLALGLRSTNTPNIAVWAARLIGIPN